MEKLIAYFKTVGLDDTDSQKIGSYFKKKLLDKHDYFVKEGKVCSQLAFLELGQLQYYSTTDQGEERTTYISLENTFVTSLSSYLNERPARENIRALTPASLWVIEKKDVTELQKQIHSFKDLYINLIEWQICCIDKSRLDLITLSAEQRYAKLLEENPELLQQAPLQYIASMLGITPRHLSRLRAKV